jgi:hypothetical protein
VPIGLRATVEAKLGPASHVKIWLGLSHGCLRVSGEVGQ